MKLPLRRLLLAASLLLLSVAAQAQSLVPGRDYVEIPGGQPFAPKAGSVEVAEVFAYWCGHCRRMQPLLAQWQHRLPANVHVVHIHAPRSAQDVHARGFFAAQALKLPPASHAALFQAMHDAQTLPLRPSAAELAGFYSRYGVSAQQFLASMDSPEVLAEVARAHQFMLASGIEGTPTLVVAGRYRVLGGDFHDKLRIARELAATLGATAPAPSR